MTSLPPEAVPSPARSRRGRWLWICLSLLGLSHLVRLAIPGESRPPAGERVVLVREVAAGGERPRAIRLAYDEFLPSRTDSSAPAILLVHGTPGDRRELTDLARALGEQRPTVAADLPGFGGSTGDVHDYGARAEAGYLLQLLDTLHLARAHLVGFGTGGGVALELQDRAPERVASLTLLSASGVQEFELLGDYHLNHGVYGLQLAGLWLLREGTPHFGWLDQAARGVPYARNFFDTDQRPLRGILQRYPGPMLILHGERDRRVSAALAREHARIVPQAELVLGDGGHFSALRSPGPAAAAIARFAARVDAGLATTRATAAPERVAAAGEPFDPRGIPRLTGLPLLLLCLILAGGTLISEDLTCITAGLMVARGSLGFATATAACFAWIFGGDLLVFLAGRSLGRPVLRRAPVRWFLSADAVAWSSQWLERQGAALVFATRVLPGTRLPTYFAAGMLRTSLARFASYFFVACLVWTPIIVGIAAGFGEAAQRTLQIFRERAALYLLVTSLALFLILKLVIPLCTFRGRRLLLARWRRCSHWEYWPRWLVYAPLGLYALWLALRHRSLRLVTAANPGLPGRGLPGASKAAVLDALRGEHGLIARHELIPAELLPEERIGQALAFRDRFGLGWPLVLKPDVGERGSGETITHSEAEVRAYLERARHDTLVQAYAPGSEFSVLYARAPGETAGRILSIVDKRFPLVTGDGRTSLEDLILGDDRAVNLAPLHFRRHAGRLAWIPAAGEQVPLVELGTPSRGAEWHDGWALRTPALEEAIDRVSRCCPGFHFGRYDIRTTDPEELRQGRRFTVVDIDGVAAVATCCHRPRQGLRAACRVLFRQWRVLNEVAAANVAHGARVVAWRDLVALARRRRGRRPAARGV